MGTNRHNNKINNPIISFKIFSTIRRPTRSRPAFFLRIPQRTSPRIPRTLKQHPAAHTDICINCTNYSYKTDKKNNSDKTVLYE